MSDTLMHHGVKGQIWGVRRYQNEDGSRTDIGRQHENALKRSNRAMTYGSFPGTPSNRTVNTNRTQSNNTVYGVIKKEDPDSITAEEEYDTIGSSKSKSSTVGVLISKKSTTGAIKNGSSVTAKILKSSEVAKPLQSSRNFYKINTGKKIAALQFKKSIT